MLAILCLAGCAALLGSWLYNRSRRSRLPYPPGPSPHFLLTNVLDFPKENMWATFNEWAKQYGGLVHLNLMGNHVLILNSMEACMDLLEKRSNKYSDRPRMVMLSELMGWDWATLIQGYTPLWRAHRRLQRQVLNVQIAESYRGTQQFYSREFARRLLHSPEALQDHIRLLFSEISADTLYGIRVSGLEDPYLQTAEKAMASLNEPGRPGAFLVDTIPALKYVPSWFPGAGFKKKAAEWKGYAVALKNLPFNHVKDQMKQGTAKPSATSLLLNSCEEGTVTGNSLGMELDKEQLEDVVASAVGAALAGASDSMLSSIKMFFLLMAKHPNVQKKAQSEVDKVVGKDCFPSVADLEALPYVHAVVKELLRWHTIVPTGFPHVSTEDDMYEGYFIPKGTVVMPNARTLSRDPKAYPNPDAFNPARWLTVDSGGKTIINKAVQDPIHVAFGFGRRICPGLHFAINSLLAVVSTTLSCFDIQPISGTPADLVVEATDGLVSYPVPYEVKITPRSKEVENLLNNTESLE